MTTFWEALEQIDPRAVEHVREYRLYYEVNGDPLFYTTEEEHGNYIVIDQETYTEGRYDVKVVDGKLVRPAQYIYQKLVPSDRGTETTTFDLSIIGPGRYWDIKYYE